MDQKGDEWGLVDVSPGEVVAAGHVIELVAEVTVTIVEENVEPESRQGNSPNHRRAVGEKGWLNAFWSINCWSGADHKVCKDSAPSGQPRYRFRVPCGL